MTDDFSAAGFQLGGGGPKAYERYLVPEFFAPCADQLFDLASPAPGQRVLDVACGTGIVARRASATVGDDGVVVGIDVNEGMLDQARAADPIGTIEWQRADATALPFPDTSFDVVYCQQGLQFVPERGRAVREMHRVLRPGGRVAIATWRSLDDNPAFAEFVDVLHRQVGEKAATMIRAAFTGPDHDQIAELLSDAGFREIAIEVGVITARFASTEEFLRREVLSSPLVDLVRPLDHDRLEALRLDVAESMRPYQDGDVLALTVQTWLTMARSALDV